MGWQYRLATGLSSIVAVVIAIAAAAKFYDLPEIGRALSTWSILPRWADLPLMVLVPLSEGAIAALWFGGVARRQLRILMAVLLGVFSAAYGIQLWTGSPPTCGCLGKLASFAEAMSEARWAFGRNALLVLLLVTSMILETGTHPGLAKSGSCCRGLRGGFSLIEVVIVILLIGTLIATVVPSLGNVRRQSRRAASLANLRSHVATTTSYGHDYREAFPFYADPRAVFTILRDQNSGTAIKTTYFGSYCFWNFALAPGYYGGNYNHASFFSPGSNSMGSFISSYWYSASLRADPTFWNAATRTGPQQWRQVSWHETEFPSKKALFVVDGREDPSSLNSRSDRSACQFGLLDGSGRWVQEADQVFGYLSGEGNWPGSWFSKSISGMHTLDGSRGRDVR